MKEGSVCCTENEILFCVFFMIPGRRVGFSSSQKKCIYSVVEVEVNGSVFLHRLFGTSPLVPSRPLFPSLTLPPRLQPPVRWEMGNPDRLCIAVDCIVLHCIALYCSLNIFQCISQETSPPGHLCSFSLFSALRHFCKETLHDLCRSYIGPSLIPKHWTHGS